MAGRVGPYEVQGEVERGPGYAVYAATHVDAGRPVWIRVLQAGAAAAPERRARFNEDARRLLGVAHPSWQTLHAAGDAEGVPYVALEPVQAERLSVLLSQRQAPLPADVAAKLAFQLACAVDALHRAGALHRDVGPHTVRLTADGVPVLTEPGLLRDLDPEQPGVVAGGRFLGTPSLRAPELEAGRLELLGPAADVYGLGQTLFALLAGSPPRPGGLIAPLASVRRDVPPALEELCRQCLAQRPSERPQSAAAVAQALAGVAGVPLPALGPAPAAAAPAVADSYAWDGGAGAEDELDDDEQAEEDAGPRRPPARSSGALPLPLLIGAAAALVLGVGAAAFLLSGGAGQPAPVEPEAVASADAEGSTAGGRAPEAAPEARVAAAPARDPARARELLAEGREHLRRSRAAGALTALEEAVVLDPDLAEAHHYLGNARYLAGEYEAALEAFGRAIGLDPQRAAPFHNRGAAAEAAGQEAAALEDYRRFLELAPEHPEAAGVRADVERLSARR